MAKDVDLSSKEWRDLIFEGKNKDFGAYKLRSESDARHNKAVLWTIIGLIVVLAGCYVYGIYNDYKIAQREAEILAAAEMAEMAALEQEPEEEVEEEEVQQRVEEQQPEALPEEILNTMKATEIAIAADEEVVEEIKSQDEIKESTTALGSTNFDQGTDDINVVREYKEEVIVEEKAPVDDNQVFQSVEQMPQFPGGEAALLKWIGDHLRYPTMAAENNIQGRVVVSFVVTKTGKIGEVKILRARDPDLDKEAIRVVKSLPDFIPGKMNGQAVNVWYNLPVNFKLQGV
ncbi:MAG: energy transducer TonB [Muribaculaceae bacterium]|nr:energy transducer TonB [Muribaculaceae bacterium]MDE7368994.1 energy transducer TonB [Muribaculaceae bacterium]